ncbi:MAG: hypothetical protein GY757_32945, partial [bacterium]|nr:hypothetical protein [bacterium]
MIKYCSNRIDGLAKLQGNIPGSSPTLSNAWFLQYIVYYALNKSCKVIYSGLSFICEPLPTGGFAVPFLFCREEREGPRKKDRNGRTVRNYDSPVNCFITQPSKSEGGHLMTAAPFLARSFFTNHFINTGCSGTGVMAGSPGRFTFCPNLFGLVFGQRGRKGTPAIAFIIIFSDRQDAFGVLFLFCRDDQKGVYVFFFRTSTEAGPGNSFKYLTTSSLNHLMRVVATGFARFNKIS